MVVPLAGLDPEHRLARVGLVDRLGWLGTVDWLGLLGALDRIIRKRGVGPLLAGRPITDVLPLPPGNHGGQRLTSFGASLAQ